MNAETKTENSNVLRDTPLSPEHREFVDNLKYDSPLQVARLVLELNKKIYPSIKEGNDSSKKEKMGLVTIAAITEDAHEDGILLSSATVGGGHAKLLAAAFKRFLLAHPDILAHMA